MQLWLTVPPCFFIAWKPRGFLRLKPFTTKIADLNKFSQSSALWLHCGFYLKWNPKKQGRVDGVWTSWWVFCRGFVYCRNEELETGWVAFGNGKLLHRPVSFDSKPHYLFQLVDQHTLQVKGTGTKQAEWITLILALIGFILEVSCFVKRHFSNPALTWLCGVCGSYGGDVNVSVCLIYKYMYLSIIYL